MRVAIMQPYFAPYLGYFRLLEAADVFVLYDCVQFPRRGWVHRNRLPDRLGRPQWMTLPLVKAPQQVRIHELEIDENRFPQFLWSWRRFPAFDDGHPVLGAFKRSTRRAVDYLETTLDETARTLGVSRPMVRSSTLAIDVELRGQDRIIEIARAIGATTYVNAPGGKQLYDAATFRRHGISLEFLPEYDGARWSVLHSLLAEPRAPSMRPRSPWSRRESA